MALPFPVASRVSDREAFDLGTYTLGANNITVNPQIIPAVGWLKSILIEVTGTVSGGTSPAYTADAPWNAIAIANFRTASGNDLVVPYTGYQLYLANKYGGYKVSGDQRNPAVYTATTSAFHFFLRVPLEIDPVTGLGAIPAMASNRSYLLNLTLAAASTVMTGGPTITVALKAYSEFWLEPAGQTSGGTAQATMPQGVGTISKWELENPSVNPGDRLVKFNNVGNVLRTHIFVARNSSGVRISDGNGWPSSGEIQLYLDNEIQFAFTPHIWQLYMAEWFGYNSATYDAYNGFDTGVYVIPWHALNGAHAGDPNNTRSQLLPTLNASQVQLRATFGSSISSLEIMTNSVVPAAGTGFAALFSK